MTPSRNGRKLGTSCFYGHNLILRLLGFQNGYFDLGLETEIQDRINMFPKIWGKGERGSSFFTLAFHHRLVTTPLPRKPFRTKKFRVGCKTISTFVCPLLVVHNLMAHPRSC